MASSYLWTFYFKGAAKILNEGEEEPFASVIATTYERAVKKIVKLKIPYVISEDELKFGSVSEEFPADDECSFSEARPE
jgi:hypothetical protein